MEIGQENIQSSSGSQVVLGRWSLIEEIGDGATSKVFLGFDSTTGQHAAVKIFLNGKQASTAVLKNEVDILSQLNHENIIGLKEFHESIEVTGSQGSTVKVPALVMELAPAGVFELMQTNGHLPEKLARSYFTQLIGALDYMHKQNIVHRDIKLENLLLDNEYSLKIGDLGFACKVDPESKLTSRAGTSTYFSPEMHKKLPYSGKQSDLFAAGMALFSMFIGHMPFAQATADDKVYQFLAQDDQDQFWRIHERILKESRPKATIGEDFKDLMNKMLEADPAKRLDIEGIKAHPWMQGVAYSQKQIVKLFAK